MSVPQNCWDVGRSGLKCICSSQQPPPTFVAVLPLIPQTPTTKGPALISIITTQDLVTRHTDTSTDNLPDAKLFGLLIGFIILFLVVVFLICYCVRKRREDTVNNVDGVDVGPVPGRGRLKLSPSNCSQKPLLRSSSAVTDHPKLALPQQPNGETEKMVESCENPQIPAVNTYNNTSFTGGDQVIPMIDDEDEDDDAVIARIMFNESSC